ncbi:hypothetical protein [Mycoplasmopsis columboralis]|uniref:Uncharacterized protein n=1 Tax=Mycoplasmopsis columboralis TaxID=171282 RepID=A0A449B6C7_9BACT|nr:hypothetical protein [Mycoplasmopsis columboralis]VEU76156.1 Uncharacterised protein [Mycoplasmopsis columboralis]
MNNSKLSLTIRIILWSLFAINLIALLVVTKSITGLVLNYPPYVKLTLTLTTMLLWTLISTFMIVFRISKITTHYMVMFILGVALAIGWIPLYLTDKKQFSWIYFKGDVFAISAILALNYFLNLIIVKRKLIITLRKYLKIK